MPKIPELPVGSTPMVGSELLPADQLGVTRYFRSGSVAQAASLWNVDVLYAPGTIVRTATGTLHWMAVTSSTAQDPEDFNSTYWLPVRVISNTTVGVGAGEEFSSIALALSYFRYAFIPSSATLTIQVIDGTYNLTNTQIALNHPCGSRIQLLGNTTTPASCALTFTTLPNLPSGELADDSGSIYINDGHAFGLIDGFTVSKAGGAAAFGHCAFLSYANSTLRLGPNMVVSGFYAQVAAAQNGTVFVEGSSGPNSIFSTTTATTFGIYCDGGIVHAPYIKINTFGLTNAVGIFRLGRVFINDADLSGVSSTSTVFLVSNSTLIAVDATVGNCALVISVAGPSVFIDDDGFDAASYGTFTNFAQVNGQFTYNGYTAIASLENYANQAALTGYEFQAEGTTSIEALQAGSFMLGTGATNHTRIQSGQVTLTAGVATQAGLTWITAGTRLFFQHATEAGTPGLRFSRSITPGASFTVTSKDASNATQTLDTSTVDWVAFVA